MSARRDATRVLFRIAFRNLAASPVRTAILGAIVLVGSLIVVVGSSVLDSIDRGMRTSIQGSLGGHVQVYDARSEGALELYGGLRGESLLEPIEDFARVKEVLAQVPNVRQVVPMGIDQAMVATGTTFDSALERLRDDVRRMEAGDRGPERLRQYAARVAHVRRMVGLLGADLDQARAIADLESREIKSRAEEFAAVRRAASEEFWAEFEGDRYAGLEFLENRVAPVAMENAFTFIRYVGTDVDAFFRAFPLAEVNEGERIPSGQRGVLVGKQFAEEWLKLKNARRLDQIKDQRDRRGKRIEEEEELQRWVRENRSGVKEILLQLDPVAAEEVAAVLRRALGAGGEEGLDVLLQRLFATTDRDFDEKYRIFYDVVAPRIRLYKINVGDVITVKAPSKSGYFSAVNVKVYGFLEFRGIEKSGIAGMMSVMDLMSFRDLYGYLTREKAEEVRRLKEAMGAREVERDRAEAELFGAPAAAPAEARSAAIDERALVRSGGERAAGAQELGSRVYSQEEIEHGVALNAALILDDARPRAIRRTMTEVRAAIEGSGLGLKVVDWQEASGLVGQFVTLLRGVLFAAVLIFFAIALVVINNAMVMATLQRVKEIGTMRAIGAQRRFVVAMLLVEIAAVGLVFGLGGAALGGVAVGIIRALGGIPAVSDLLYFVFSGPALFPTLGRMPVATSLAIVLAVAILSALYPAWIAMKVTPVEAMATED
ncbi:MAG TPA: FtsX-like permease family protein [Anaeromyxobacter sp.]|nr:FtsX-like permease family protein [Anaeromyxobacter sp.]